MAITPENIDDLKKHIRDLKYAAVKIGKYKLEEGQTVDDLELSTKELIETAIEIRILEVDKQVSNSEKDIDKDRLYAIRTWSELLKAYRNEKTTVVKGADSETKNEVVETVMDKLKKSIIIEPLDK